MNADPEPPTEEIRARLQRFFDPPVRKRPEPPATRRLRSERQRLFRARQAEADPNVHPLRAKRVKLGLTTAQLARLALVSESAINQIETDRLRGSALTLQRLARALAIDPQQLRR